MNKPLKRMLDQHTARVGEAIQSLEDKLAQAKGAAHAVRARRRTKRYARNNKRLTQQLEAARRYGLMAASMNNPHVWVQHYDGMAGRFFKQYAKRARCALVISRKTMFTAGRKGGRGLRVSATGRGGRCPIDGTPIPVAMSYTNRALTTPEAAMLWSG